LCGTPPTTPVYYAGGTLTMAASATNYVFLPMTSTCLPTSNTTGFVNGGYAIAIVVTGASSITAVTDFVLAPASPNLAALPGGIYNVSIYGAAGNGTHDDTAALNAAIAACNAGGGMVYLPLGTFLVSSTLTTITNQGCGVMGEGIGSVIGASSSSVQDILKIATGFTNGNSSVFQNFEVNCNLSNPSEGSGRQNNAFHQVDSIGVTYRDLRVINCSKEFIVEDQAAWSERNLFDHITVDNFVYGWLLQLDAGDGYNSMGYNWWDHIEFNTQATGDAVWTVTGLANLYSCKFHARGNMANGTYVFNVSGGQQVTYGDFAVHAEGGSGVVGFYTSGNGSVNNSCGSTSACVHGSGFVLLTGGPPVLRSGNFYIFDLSGGWAGGWTTWPGGSLQYAMSITTTAVTSEMFSNTSGYSNIQNLSAACVALPANSIAAGMVSGTYVVSGTSVFVIYHPATAGGIFGIYCN
jgi:hypothetical protein